MTFLAVIIGIILVFIFWRIFLSLAGIAVFAFIVLMVIVTATGQPL